MEMKKSDGLHPETVVPDSEHTSDKNRRCDDSVRQADRNFIVRVAAVVLGILGVIMLVCGIFLRNLDQAGQKVPDKEQMPQEYIDEFFSDEGFTPDIRDFIEPEA
jgi:hypothetical protein